MVPSWETLNKIRQLSIYAFAKWALILIPILASGALFLQQHSSYRIPLPVNLVCLYASALLFFASSLLTDLFCPPAIKEHGSYERFFEFLSNSITTIAEARNRSTERTNALLDEFQAEAAKLVGQPGREDKMSGAFGKLIAEAMSAVFMEEARTNWDSSNKQDFKAVRAVVALGYVLSALAGLYVTFVDAPQRVFQAMTS